MFSNQKVNPSPSRKLYDEDPVQYLHTFFKLAYYLCAVPFRIEVVSSSVKAPLASKGTFVARRWLPQQILCYSVTVWCLYKYIPSLYSTKFNSSKISGFDLVALLTSFGVRTSFMYIMTTRQAQILSVLNYVREDQQLERKNGSDRIYRNGKIKWIFGALSIFYTCIGAVYIVTGVAIDELSNWNPKKIWAAYVGQTRFNVFLRDQNDSVEDFSEITVADHLGTAIFVVLKCGNLIGSHVVGNAFLSMSLFCNHLARDFQRLIKQREPLQGDKNGFHDKIMYKFWRLRYLINEKVNNIYGIVMLFWVMEGVLYYSCYLDSIFNEKNRFQQFRNILYIGNYIATLILAADTHYRISGMKEWVLEHQLQGSVLSESDLIVTLSALSPCDVGVKALGFFTVTYEFLGAITHVVITYAVILLSFQVEGEKPLSFYGYTNVI